jgi:hypothetical protein
MAHAACATAYRIGQTLVTNGSMLELMHQEQTNSSIAWKIEIHNFLSADLFTQRAKSEKLGLRIDNPCGIVG